MPAKAVQYLYLAYLAAVKDQDGAAMSLGRTSTFLDIYIEKDIREGKLTEEEAQELIDQFIIKLRMSVSCVLRNTTTCSPVILFG